MSKPSPLQIRYLTAAQLKPRASQARTHSRAQIRQIADSIRVFGFNNPILVDAEGAVVAGHGRLEAAKLLGIGKVPTVRLDHMTETQIRAYVLADNRLAEHAKWDYDLLALELRYLSELDLEFEVSVTGFEIAEIDLLLQNSSLSKDQADTDILPPVIEGSSPVSRQGDLWILGRHRLLCGDARDRHAYRQLLGSRRGQVVFTDPPYNLPIEGHVSGLGKARHSEFAMASGEMDETQFTAFLQGIFRNLAEHSIDGSIHFIFMDWRHLFEVLVAGRSVYSELKNLCVWSKSNAGMGSLYRSKHELILVFKSGTRPHINNVELGRHGRYRANVWEYTGLNSFGADRDDALAMHPTVKPVALAADALLDCSRRGAIVLDPFVGSGTTIIAAERTGRRAYAIEIDPGYVDTAIRRYETYSGDTAIHGESGAAFREMAEQRAAADGPLLEKTATAPALQSGTSPRASSRTRPVADPIRVSAPPQLPGQRLPDSARLSKKPLSRLCHRPGTAQRRPQIRRPRDG